MPEVCCTDIYFVFYEAERNFSKGLIPIEATFSAQTALKEFKIISNIVKILEKMFDDFVIKSYFSLKNSTILGCRINIIEQMV